MKQIIQNRCIIQDVIKNIEEENTLKKFFIKNNIAEVDHIIDIQEYQKNDYRGGLILTVLEKGFDDKTKILVDVRHGLPTINQVYDSLYDIGKDCNIRIITYTNRANGHDKFNPANDEYAILSLMARLQANNVPIAFYEIDHENSEMKYIDLYQEWHRVDRSKSCELPTREQFMAETFWSVYFDSLYESFYEPWNAFTGRFINTDDWRHMIYIDCAVYGGIKIYWDQDGVRYVIQQTDDSDGTLQKALDIDMPYLQGRYGSEAIEWIWISGRMPRLQIRYSERPFDWLYDAEPEQILEFAKAVHEDAWALRFRIEELIGEKNETLSA